MGLVACGVRAAADSLGDAVEGWFGPCQWLREDAAPPVALDEGADYPAAQALAAGLVASQALARAGSADPGAMWHAARSLTTTTFLGPFAVDDAGLSGRAPAGDRAMGGGARTGSGAASVWRPEAQWTR